MDELVTWIVSLLKPAEWTAVLWVMVVVYSVTEIIKRAWRAITGRYSSTEIWFVVCAVGFVASYLLWPRTSTTAWWLAGICAGPMSAVLHKVGVEALARISPKTAALVTGERRRRDIPAPGGIERRGNPIG